MPNCSGAGLERWVAVGALSQNCYGLAGGISREGEWEGQGAQHRNGNEMKWNGNSLGRNGAEISSHRLGSQQEHIHLSVSPGCDNSSAARHVAAPGTQGGKGECTAVLHPKTELCFLFTSSVTGLKQMLFT